MLNLVVKIGIPICLALMLVGCAREPVEWHMVNVNVDKQGDAHLLVDNGVNILIDTGRPKPAEEYLVPYLAEHEIKVIHDLFISHPHTDHYGGLAPLVAAGIEIENLYYNLPPEGVEDWNYKRDEFLAAVALATDAGARAIDINEGLVVATTNSRLEVLHAQKQSELNGKPIKVNDFSVIMQWQVADNRVLFTGDLSEALGEELSKNSKYQADILKVPHHGVTPIAPNAFFDSVNPNAAMAPATKALLYHPRSAQVNKWAKYNLLYYCHNGRNGTVVLTFNRQSVESRSDKPSGSCPDGQWNLKPAV